MGRRLHALRGNDIRLDGGAMFGNAPRPLWESWAPPDDRNRIDLATRALLVVEDDRLVLLETGVGAGMPPRLRERYGIAGDANRLLVGLRHLGLSDPDVRVVVLSHLHFDHAGGLLSDWRDGEAPHLLFPNARFLVSKAAWERAMRPHDRDSASFLPEIVNLLQASGRLDLVETDRSPVLGDGYRLYHSFGHTPGLLCTEMEGAAPVVYASDLVPGRAWVHSSITMGYDRNPELVVDEKKALLTYLARRAGRIVFAHDPTCAMARVVRDDQNRFGSVDPEEFVQGLEV